MVTAPPARAELLDRNTEAVRRRRASENLGDLNRSHDAVIRVYDEAGNMIETQE